MPASGAAWTLERIDLLKRCLDAGLSCGQTAREIGVTRNAVIGKINRLGLSRRKDVVRRQQEERPAATLARPKASTTWHPKRSRLNIPPSMRWRYPDRIRVSKPFPSTTGAGARYSSSVRRDVGGRSVTRA